jgi:cation diffusion facilitator CzcD-associated flavoprotein CzcO
VGGNWRYENDNEMSSAYRSLHINTSRGLMAYKTYPMPDDYPDYPNHFQIARYFDDYVDHFGLREKIRFRTAVKRVAPVEGEWEVTVENAGGERETHRYRAVLVANGHHWDPRWPEPPFPGSDEFEGEQIHVHHYREPEALRGKRVLVLGIGNSATDIAVEASRIAEKTFLAMRRGAYVMPKYLNGKPTDEAASKLLTMMPLPVQRFVLGRMLGLTAGDMTAYGLPKPDHKLLEAHPTVSAELLSRLGHGDIAVKPNIHRFSGGRTVRFVDGSEEEADLVVYCTGYKISFPFFDEKLISATENRLPLYRRVVSPEHPGLYFIGLIQPLGAIMPLAEAQAEWVADLLDGRGTLPSPSTMQDEISEAEKKLKKRYVASKRHTIQVDFQPYLREIRRERKRAAQRV